MNDLLLIAWAAVATIAAAVALVRGNMMRCDSLLIELARDHLANQLWASKQALTAANERHESLISKELVRKEHLRRASEKARQTNLERGEARRKSKAAQLAATTTKKGA